MDDTILHSPSLIHVSTTNNNIVHVDRMWILKIVFFLHIENIENKSIFRSTH